MPGCYHMMLDDFLDNDSTHLDAYLVSLIGYVFGGQILLSTQVAWVVLAVHT